MTDTSNSANYNQLQIDTNQASHLEQLKALAASRCVPTTQAPCPSCGHCPTCGRNSRQYVPSYPWQQPWYYQPTVTCGSSMMDATARGTGNVFTMNGPTNAQASLSATASAVNLSTGTLTLRDDGSLAAAN